MDVRSQILQEATRLFAAQGFDGTSVQQIADAVGIRKPSLLYHFASKEALRLSVLDAIMAHFNQVLPEVLLAAARDRRFDSVMESLSSFFLEDPDRARLLVRELLDRPEDMKERLGEFVRPWIQVVADQLERAKGQGLVQANVDTEAYAIQVLLLVVGSVAMQETLQAVLLDSGDRGPAPERSVRELIRIARSSLYTAGRGPQGGEP